MCWAENHLLCKLNNFNKSAKKEHTTRLSVRASSHIMVPRFMSRFNKEIHLCYKVVNKQRNIKEQLFITSYYKQHKGPKAWDNKTDFNL